MKRYLRKKLYSKLKSHLAGSANFVQAVVGPRQVGKTTLVKQIYEAWKGPKFYETADMPGIINEKWLVEIWEKARNESKKTHKKTLLIIDEIQKITRWSTTVKRFFDEDNFSKIRLRVIILGSSSLLMQKGLTESLAGRFELHRHSQWSYKECREFFHLNLKEYLYFGSYPAALPLRKYQERWVEYIRASLIETVIAKDVLLMNPVTKPALLRQSFALCLHYPAQILSYQNMLGQLQEAGNASTIAFYLRLLANAFFLVPLEKYSGSKIKQKSSSPKILLLDNSIITANSGISYKKAYNDKAYRGRLFENAVGARLYWFAQEEGWELFYWRERDFEVDYILSKGKRLIAVEVKSGYPGKARAALDIFARRYKNAEKVVIAFKKNDLSDVKYLEAKEFFLNPEKVLEKAR